MKTNNAGLALIREFEQCRLVAYRDPVGVWTIGWGHTGPEVVEGLVWTQEKADAQMAADLARFEVVVMDACYQAIGGTNPNQFSAMVALAYNIGVAGFSKSTVLKRHREGDGAGAAKAFAMWNKATGEDGKKRELKGLTRRRAAEALLYLTPIGIDEIVDPQRTRASDVEASVDAIGRKAAWVAGTIGACATAAQQAIGGIESVWTSLQSFGGIGANVVMALCGLVAVLAICLTLYLITRRRS